MPLLLVVAPAARAVDGEAVRVARDVLSAAASVKLVLPENLGELDRVLEHRGRRRPVVIGDDRALHHVVRLLHRQRSLDAGPIGLVPVGRGEAMSVARALGVPSRPEEAARAVLRGAERRLDLLTDDSGGVAVGAVRIPGRGRGSGRPAALRTRRAGARREAGLPEEAAAAGPEAVPAAGAASAVAAEAAAVKAADAEAVVGVEAVAEAEPQVRAGVEAQVEASGASPSAEAPTAAAARVPSPSSAASPHGPFPAERPGDHPNGAARSPSANSAGAEVEVRPGRSRPRLPFGGLLGAWGALGSGQRLRIEADGRLLTDLDRTVRQVAMWKLPCASGDEREGLVELVVRGAAGGRGAMRVWAREVTVTGADFEYLADSALGGPVRTRTWTVVPQAWRVIVPDGPADAGHRRGTP